MNLIVIIVLAEYVLDGAVTTLFLIKSIEANG